MNTEPAIPTEPSGNFIDVDTYRKLDAECELLKAELRLREAEIRQLHVTVCCLIINEKHPIEFNKTATHYFQIFPCRPSQPSSPPTAPAKSAADQMLSVFPRMAPFLAKVKQEQQEDPSNSAPSSMSKFLEILIGKIEQSQSQTASPNATPPPESTSS